MQSEQQQRIMGYFIEEAKDHLNTIEQGLLNLKGTIEDPEMVNEVFRAAHSVKGGAAMLGLTSIQHTAHRLEDYFKVLKECPLKVDQKLESLFLRVFDTLQELLEQLQGPFGLTEDKAGEAMAGVEPVFAELSQHLSLLLSQAGGTLPEDVELIPVTASSTPQFVQPSVQPAPVAREESALQFIFQNDVPVRLRDMLQVFKQADHSESRQQLQQLCRNLARFGEQLDLSGWCDLLEIAQQAIANPDNTYRTLAPIVIKDIKRAQELVLTGRSNEILPSGGLLELLPLEEPVEAEVLIDSDLAALLVGSDLEDNSTEPIFLDFTSTAEETTEPSFTFDAFDPEPAIELEPAEEDWFTNVTLSQDITTQAPEAQINAQTEEDDFSLDFDLEFAQAVADHSGDELDLDLIDSLNENAAIAQTDDHTGPEVGVAELNSLADLFEGETPDLGLAWQEEEILDDASITLPEPLELESPNDFSDLLFDPNSPEDLTLDELEEEDLSGLLNTSEHQASSPTDQQADDLQLDFGLVEQDFQEDAWLFSASDDADEMSEARLGSEASASSPSNSRDLDELFGGLDEEDESADPELPEAQLDGLEIIFGESSEDSDSLFTDTDEITSSFEEEQPEPFATLETEPDFFTSALFQSAEENTLEEVPSLSNQLTDSLSNSPEIGETGSDVELDFAQPQTEAADLALTQDEQNLTSNLWDDSSEDDRSNPLFAAEAFDPAEVEANQGSSEADLNDLWSEENFSAIADEADTTRADLASPPLDSLFDDLDEESVADQDDVDINSVDANENDRFATEVAAAPSAIGIDETDAALDALFAEEALEPSLEPTPVQSDAVEPALTSEFDLSDLFEDDSSDSISDSGENPFQALEVDGSDAEVELESIFALEADPSFDQPAVEPNSSLEMNTAIPFGFDDSSDLSFDFESAEHSDLDDAMLGFTSTNLSDDGSPHASNFDSFSVETEEQITAAEGINTFTEFAENEETFDLDLAHTGEASDATEEDGFADLEAMLGEAVPASLEGMTLDRASEPDEFDQLETMLAADIPVLTSLEQAAVEPDEFDDLEALLEDDRPAVPSPLVETTQSSIEDEFDDLEALLKDADQTLGVGSSPTRKASSVAHRRPNRRNGLSDQTMRVSVKHLDNLNNLVGEMVVNRNSLEQAQERLRQFLDNLLYQVQQLSDVGQRMRDLYERSLLESSLLSGRRSYQLSSQGGNFTTAQTSHVTGASFDALEMDRFTGFHTLSQEMIELIVRVRESASDIDFVVEESDQVTRNFRQITTQLQEGLTRSRMVPFAQTADRLPRGVRDNSLKYGKQAELVIEGRETLIDKMIVEQLYDPMTHLVNNAVAHGIETPEERIAAGKSPTGRIVIRTFHQGNQTVISVSDDGAGINPEKVREKAVTKGLITAAQAREMTRLDTYDLLFHHGFSTADQVDDLRGRGVGLDVVRNNLNEIRGAITIDSTIGKGTTFTIRLPLTLSISKALCCISNRARIAFPMDGVEDMLDVPKERIQTDEEGRSCIQWRDALLPFQPLSDLLKYNRVLGRGSVYGGNQEEDIISVVVLRSAGNFLALQVDQVLGEQEIVIKQLEGPVPKPVGVAGATVLGDGRIMPIADVLELIDLWQGRIRREPGSSLWDKGEDLIVSEASLKTESTVLIVDDSITVRELLSMTFNKVGYRVEQARDGQEAWEKLRAGLPCDLVFCDIEMPRMDGLELLSRIQKDPNLNHLPIAMLTSRGADRHRQMAVQLGAKGYFTKPYLEEVLLDAAQRMLKGEILVGGS